MIMVLAPDKRARQAAASRASNQQRTEKAPEGALAAENGAEPVPPAETNGNTPEVEVVSTEAASTEEG